MSRVRRALIIALFSPLPHCRSVSHVWLFEGAEGGKWVDDVEKKSLGFVEDGEESDLTGDSEAEDEHPEVTPPIKRARTA